MNDKNMGSQQLVALFSKALADNLTEAPKRRECASNWVTIGYFDMLQLYSVSDQKDMQQDSEQVGNWLKDIRRNNIFISKDLCGRHYLHALHLIPIEWENGGSSLLRNEKNQNSELNHLGVELPYLCLTLVQGATVLQEDGSTIPVKSEQLRMIAEELRDESVSVQCFHTIELSDLVIVWRSKNLCDIIDKIRGLYDREEVADISTFPAVSLDFLKRRGWRGNEEGENKIFVSSKYIVKEADLADEYFRSIGSRLKSEPDVSEHIYFTVGLEDLHYVQEDVPIGEYLEQLRLRFEDEKVRNLFKRAFYECTTQIGIHREINRKKNIPENLHTDLKDAQLKKRYVHPLSPKCDKLLKDFQENWEDLGKWMGPRGYSWMKATSNLLNALTDMSRSWVMDGFCYLIVDAAQMFCDDIIDQVQHRGEKVLTDEDLMRIQRFIRGWGSLMEQATRIDGRYIQMPGFSPALCEIPARLLEFYLAFTKSCTALIDCEVAVSLLLVPKICRRIKVEPTVDKKNKNLLYVDIPMDLLYDQTSVLCSLSHEISHFVGERWRCREARKYYLTYVTAYELSMRLDITGKNTVGLLYTKIKRHIDRENETCFYAKELQADLFSAAKYMLYNETIYAELHDCYVKEQTAVWTSMERNLWEIKNAVKRQKILSNDSELETLLARMIYLFRECYADVSMIYLLRPSREHYFELAAKEWETLKADFKEPKENNRYFIFLERVGTVLNLASIWGDELELNTWLQRLEKQGENFLDFLKDIQLFLKWMAEGEKQDTDDFDSRESMRTLRDYLEECYGTIHASFDNDQQKRKLDEIRNLFKAVSSENSPHYSRYEECINEYRNSLL